MGGIEVTSEFDKFEEYVKGGYQGLPGSQEGALEEDLQETLKCEKV